MISRLLMMVAVVALVATACGDSGSTAPGPVDVTGVDYAFQGLPASVAAGSTLMFENDSDAELHELVAIRLPDDETRTAAELLQLPPEEVGPLLGDPAAVLIAMPGEAAFPAVGTGQLTEAGRYVILCAIPIGIDPAVYVEAVEANTEPGPPVIEGAGPPHFTAGMVAELTVTG